MREISVMTSRKVWSTIPRTMTPTISMTALFRATLSVKMSCTTRLIHVMERELRNRAVGEPSLAEMYLGSLEMEIAPIMRISCLKELCSSMVPMVSV
jgi:hypothetical protein